MAATRISNPYVQYLDSTGEPVAAGTLTVYQNGTTTLASIYSDAALTVAQSNPYTLNSLGQVAGDIFINETVRLLLKDSSGSTIWQLDDVNVEADADAIINLLAAKGCAFTYADVVSAGYTITAGDVVRGSNGNTYKYNSGSVVDPVTDTPYDQDSGLSNSGAWTDVVIANAPLTPGSSTITDIEADVESLQTSVNFLETSISGSNGLAISNNVSDSDHDLDVATGSILDSTGSVTMVLSTAITKRIDAAGGWVAGNGNGGFPSLLTLTADTWYRVFLIAKVDGTSDVGFDSMANSNAAALLNDASDYSFYKQIGYVYSNASLNIENFTKTGNLYTWKSPNASDDTGGSNLPTTKTNYSVLCPPNLLCSVNARLRLNVTGASNNVFGFITSPDQTDVTPTSSYSNIQGYQDAPSVTPYGNSICLDIVTNSNSEISARFDGAGTSGSDVCYFITLGYYYDPRSA